METRKYLVMVGDKYVASPSNKLTDNFFSPVFLPMKISIRFLDIGIKNPTVTPRSLIFVKGFKK